MNNFFSIEQRVYYENTDAGGVIFYGEYLRFLERARTEHLRSLGHNVAELAKSENPTLFVVRKVNIEYIKPIFLDNLITITSVITNKTRSTITFNQDIYIDETITTKADVMCVAIGKNGKVKRLCI